MLRSNRLKQSPSLLGRRIGCFGLLLLCAACKQSNHESTGLTTTPSEATKPALPTIALAPVEPVSSTPPHSFRGAPSVALEQVGAAGCDARATKGWLQIQCPSRNPAGGKLLKVELQSGAVPSQEPQIMPDVDGAASFVLPWQPGRKAKARVYWTDAHHELSVDGNSGKMERVIPFAVRQTCEELEHHHRDLLKVARAGQGAVSRHDVQRFPRFGQCEFAGQGAWALAVEQLQASGEGLSREVRVVVNVVHVDSLGARTQARYTTLAFSPGRVRVPPLMVYDYDADTQPEVIVRHDILARPDGRRDVPLPAVSPVFTYKHGEVTPYAFAGTASGGGVLAQQLDADMRPDVGGYGPFLAWLGPDCGLGKCPERIIGPRFFKRSLGTGMFAPDERTDQVVRRECRLVPERVVGAPLASAPDKQRTAMNIACALLRGTAGSSVAAELLANRRAVCGDNPSCDLLRVFLKWTNSKPPRALSE